MPSRTSHRRSHGGLWGLLNRPQAPEPDTMRIGCTALVVFYGAICMLRVHEAGVAFTGLRIAMLLYAALGVHLAGRVTWPIQRGYAVGLALALPLQAAYIDAAQGNHLSDVAFTALAIFVSLIFVQTARDLIAVDVCLLAGNALILHLAPPPVVPLPTLAVMLAAVITTASVIALRTLLYRARWGESVARLEAALAERAEWQSRYEAATAASGQVLYDWEPATNRLRYGGAFQQILGYTLDELGGGLAQWIGLVHPEDVERFETELRDVVAYKRSFRLRYRVRRKDGAVIVVDDSGHFVFDEHGDVVRMVGFVADVTERDSAERARDEEAATSAALARVGRELISSLETPVLMDRLCRVTTEVLGCDFGQTWIAEPEAGVYRALAAYGLSPEEWEQLRLLRLSVGPVNPLIERLGREDVVPVAPETPAYPMLTALMAYYGFGSSLVIALRRGDDVIGAHVVGQRAADAPFTAHQCRIARGIGQLASMALTNAKLVEELERASSLKSEFVSTMSHELRTPLNVILGYTDMLVDDTLSAHQRQLVARIRRSSVELLEMIEATLDLSRIAAGRDVPALEPVALADLWSELATEFAALPRHEALTLRWEPTGEAALRTDRRKLKMILKNLVGNALKFTPAGEVVVGCVARGDDIVFTVRDTGIGIPAEHLPSIFDMFRQVDSSDARSYSGAGLGLYIVRQLATQLGGSVGVESVWGRGSTFEVVLPTAPRDEGRQIAA